MDDANERNYAPRIITYRSGETLDLPPLASGAPMWQRVAEPPGDTVSLQILQLTALAYTPALEQRYDLDALMRLAPEASPHKAYAPNRPCILLSGRTERGSSVLVKITGAMMRVKIAWDNAALDPKEFVNLLRRRCVAADAFERERASPIAEQDMLYEIVEQSHVMNWDPSPESIALAAAQAAAAAQRQRERKRHIREFDVASDCATHGSETDGELAEEPDAASDAADPAAPAEKPPVPLPPRAHRYLVLYVAGERLCTLLQYAVAGRKFRREFLRGDWKPAELDRFERESDGLKLQFPLYESDVMPATQIFARTRTRPGGWLCVDRGPARDERHSHADLEVWLDVPQTLDAQRRLGEYLRPVARDGYAPVVIESFDIECSTPGFGFPNAELEDHRVDMVSATVDRLNSTERPFRFTIVCVPLAQDPAVIRERVMAARRAQAAHNEQRVQEQRARDPGFDLAKRLKVERRSDFVVAPDLVILCPDEGSLLDAWRLMNVFVVDPDILTGYNLNFDLKFLSVRAQRYAAYGVLHDHFTRLIHVKQRATERVLSSKAYGDNVIFKVAMPGRFVLDMLLFVKREYKLASYTLKYVAPEFLWIDKVDMPIDTYFRIIHARDPARAWDAVVYNVGDADLPLMLMHTLCVLPALFEQSIVTKTQVDDLLQRGQQIKVFNQIYTLCEERGVCLDRAYTGYEEPDADADSDDEDEDESYEGGAVIEPRKGYYPRTPIVTNDYSSLYPSIMYDNNLSIDTLVRDPRFLDLPGVRYSRIEYAPGCWDVFVHRSHHLGLIGELLIWLLRTRKKVKKELGAATDPLSKVVLDKRQLSLKVSANSVYGSQGAKTGKLYTIQIARGTTAKGRDNIHRSIALTHERLRPEHCDKNGAPYPPGRVVYGDTDSFMIEYPTLSSDSAADLQRAWDVTVEIAEYVTAQLRDGPDSIMAIETEKISKRSILVRKKCYAFYMTEKLGKDPFKKKMSGFEAVRRDKPQIEKGLQSRVLDALLVDGDPAKAEKLVCDTLQQIVDDSLDLDVYTVSKELKSIEAYKNPEAEPHVCVVRKQRARNPGYETQTGQRVQFVYVQGASKRKSERAEDPEYVRAKRLKIDRLHYFDQLRTSTCKILQYCVAEPEKRLFAQFRGTLERQRSGCRSLLEMAGGRERRASDAAPPTQPQTGAPPQSSSFRAAPDAKERKARALVGQRTLGGAPAAAPAAPSAAGKKKHKKPMLLKARPPGP